MKSVRVYSVITMVAAIAVLTAAAAWAGVTAPNQTKILHPGQTMQISLEVFPSEPLAGFNGRMHFDPKYFTNPQVIMSTHPSSFVALGNEKEPGDYWFVLYSNPSAVVAYNTIFNFLLTMRNTNPTESSSVITFTDAAASNLAGVSIGDVNLGTITVQLESSGAQDWALYE